MATHLNTVAWRIPWPEEPGGLTALSKVPELDMTEAICTVQLSRENHSFSQQIDVEHLLCAGDCAGTSRTAENVWDVVPILLGLTLVDGLVAKLCLTLLRPHRL